MENTLPTLSISHIPVKGEAGETVKAVQSRLNDLGIKVIVDGIFGNETQLGLMHLQQKNNMLGTGVINEKTLALLSMQIVVAPHPTPAPSPVDGSLVEQLIAEAMKYQGVHESGGNNRGPQIDIWEAAFGLKGLSWCMMFQQEMIKAVTAKTGVKSRIHRSAGCMDVWDGSPADMKFPTPQAGDLIIWRHGGTSSGHVGLVTKVLDAHSVETIEGNTSSASHVERNGDGVYVKTRSLAGQGDMRVVGFVRVWKK